MKKIRLNIIGCGNMSNALIPLISNKHPEISFYTYTPTMTKAVELAEKIEGTVCKSLGEMNSGDYYFLACKPQQFEDLAKKLRPIIDSNCTVISVMAGVSTKKISDLLSIKKIIRVMPNTPSSIGLGVHGVFGTDDCNLKLIQKWLSSTGKVFTFDNEDQINKITPFSGSGPAYIFEMASILSEKMSEYGFSEEDSRAIIAQTFVGASQMLVISTESSKQLRENVTSKNGVTEKALLILEENKLKEVFSKAIDGAYDRSLELND